MLLQALRSAFPAARITFNGAFNDVSRANIEEKLRIADGMEVEFFYGKTESQYPDARLLDEILHWTTVMNRQVLLQSAGGVRVGGTIAVKSAVIDVRARLESLAGYLLVSNPNVFYYYVADPDAYQVVSVFPEWTLPLGKAVVEAPPGLLSLVRPDGVVGRAFENGLALANANAGPVTVPTPGMHRVQVFGGFLPDANPIPSDPRLAEYYDGRLQYQPVSSVTLAPGETAILVTNP